MNPKKKSFSRSSIQTRNLAHSLRKPAPSKKAKDKSTQIKNVVSDLEARFTVEIVEMVQSGADMVDAVITWCSRNGVEVEVGGSMIKNNRVLKSKMTDDAEELKFIKPRKSHSNKLEMK